MFSIQYADFWVVIWVGSAAQRRIENRVVAGLLHEKIFTLSKGETFALYRWNNRIPIIPSALGKSSSKRTDFLTKIRNESNHFIQSISYPFNYAILN